MDGMQGRSAAAAGAGGDGDEDGPSSPPRHPRRRLKGAAAEAAEAEDGDGEVQAATSRWTSSTPCGRLPSQVRVCREGTTGVWSDWLAGSRAARSFFRVARDRTQRDSDEDETCSLALAFLFPDEDLDADPPDHKSGYVAVIGKVRAEGGEGEGSVMRKYGQFSPGPGRDPSHAHVHVDPPTLIPLTHAPSPTPASPRLSTPLSARSLA